MSNTPTASTDAVKTLAPATQQEINAEIYRRLGTVESINNMLTHEIDRLLAEVAELKTVCA